MNLTTYFESMRTVLIVNCGWTEKEATDYILAIMPSLLNKALQNLKRA